jgi:hypothetical protein
MPEPNSFPSKNPPQPLPSGKKSIHSIWFYPLLACFILLLLLAARKIDSYDVGFHLKGGQWICEHFSWPQKDTYTYTQSDRDYLDSNGLYQVLLYSFYAVFGYSSLTFLNIAVIFVFFVLLWLLLRQTSAPQWGKCLVLLASIFLMERRFIVRPEIFSWLYFITTLNILESRRKQTQNLLFLLPLIQWLWVNTEGLFMLGWVAMAAYWLSGRIHEKRFDPILTRYFFLSLAVDILNPYGFKGLMFPFTLWTRLQASSLYKQNIVEFYSPWHMLATQNLHFDSHLYIFLFFVFSLLSSLLMILTFRQRKFHELFLFGVFLLLACTAVRNIPLFVPIAAPLLLAGLADEKIKSRFAWLENRKMALGLTLLIGLLGMRVATNAYYASDRRVDRIGFGLDAEELPVGAALFLSQNQLNGRLLNDLDSGGWLDWQAPQPTFIDGRLEVPEDAFYQQYRESFQPGGLFPLLIRYQPQLVVINYNASRIWMEQLMHFSDWRLIYVDSCSAIYAHEGYALQCAPLNFESILENQGITNELDDAIYQQIDQMPPQPFQTWIQGFYRFQNYPMGLLNLGLFSMKYDQSMEARLLFLKGLKEAGGGDEEIYYNLAVANLHLGNLDLGRLCLQDTLQLDPSNPSALQMLNNLSR